MTESKTPRTNAEAQRFQKSGVDWHYSATLMRDFALTLEKELEEYKRQAALYSQDTKVVMEQRDSLNQQLALMKVAFEREVDSLKQQLKEKS